MAVETKCLESIFLHLLSVSSESHSFSINPTPSVGPAAFCPESVAKMLKVAEMVQLLSMGSTGLP